jgi:hypothetical protein
VNQVNRRETESVCDSLADALEMFSKMIERDTGDGLKVSSATVTRHARPSIRTKEIQERYFVNVQSYDGV